MEKPNFFNGDQGNFEKAPKTLSEAILENPSPINQAYGELKPTSSDVFIKGNKHTQQEVFADLFGELAGFDKSQESRDVATNSVALVDLIARLYGRKVDGIGAYDDFFKDGKAVLPEEVDKILQPYMQDNEAVNWLVDEYTIKVDPDKVNEAATKRLLKVAMYLTEETEEMQAEVEEQAKFDERFRVIANAETHQNEVNERFDGIVAESLPSLRSQEHFNREFDRQVQGEYSAEFAEIVDGVELKTHLDNRTEEQYAEAFNGIVDSFEGDELPALRAVKVAKMGQQVLTRSIENSGEMARAGVELGGKLLQARADRNKALARAGFNLWGSMLLPKSSKEHRL